MKKNEKKKYHLKNKKIIFGVLLLIILTIIGASYYKNKQTLDKIKRHYNQFIITNKLTTLYNKKEEKIGTIAENMMIELKKVNITNIKNKFFNIKDTDYYIYYEDATKEKNGNTEEMNSNYIPLNKKITSKEKISLIKDAKEVATLTKNINLPVEYEDDQFYYVKCFNQILQVKKDKSIKEEEYQHTKEKTADHISVLFYNEIAENCNDINCTTLANIKDQINKLKENGYYTITIKEYKEYLKNHINLKEKAVLLTTNRLNDTINNLKNETKENIESVEDNEIIFYATNKTTTKKTDINELDCYLIKNYTSIENYLKMAAGEEVKEEVPADLKSTVERQGIAVLNYHFFYDEQIGGCNESICLSTKKLRDHLEYLKTNGFKAVTMKEFKKWMYGEIELPTKSVLITVDDGAMGTGAHNGNFLIPLLEEYKMHATLFLIAGWWDIKNYQSPYLNIQSHTYDMHLYGTCGRGQINCATYEEARADLQKSLDIIGNDDSFCFPFYMYNDTSLKAVQDAGFKLAFVGGNRKATRNSNKFLIPRYPIISDITLNDFISIVN